MIRDSFGGIIGELRGAWRAWNGWFFEPISVVSVSLFRIFFGLLVLAFTVLMARDAFVWLGPNGIFTPADSDRFWRDIPHWSILLMFPPSNQAVVIFLIAFAAAAVCLTIGLFTRWAAIAVFIGIVSIHHRDPLFINGGDTVIRLMAFYLIFAPCGAALSVDRLIRLARGQVGPEPVRAPPWAQRLIALQIAFVYLASVIIKFRGDAWLHGYALYITSRLEEFERFPTFFMFKELWIVNILTYWTLATELSLGLLVWFKPLRKFVLLNGLALHLGIEYTMNIPLFGMIMMSTYVNYVDVEAWWHRVLASRPLRDLQRGTLYLGNRLANRGGLVPVLQAIDMVNRYDIVPPSESGRTRPAGDPLLWLQTDDGRERVGLSALRWLAWRAPVLLPAAPLLYLPGVPALLQRLSGRWVGAPQTSVTTNPSGAAGTGG